MRQLLSPIFRFAALSWKFLDVQKNNLYIPLCFLKLLFKQNKNIYIHIGSQQGPKNTSESLHITFDEVCKVQAQSIERNKVKVRTTHSSALTTIAEWHKRLQSDLGVDKETSTVKTV